MKNLKEIIFIGILLLIALSSGIDLATDLSHGAAADHIAKEGVIVLMSLITILWLIAGLRAQMKQISELKQQLKASKHPEQLPPEYVVKARKQFSEVVNQQFTDWKLTASEAEVGWLLLKGLSLKEVAVVRNTLEKTVRQQASSIYKKAGVNGRHAFAAWFLEDLME